jgi:hypothetical protein
MTRECLLFKHGLLSESSMMERRLLQVFTLGIVACFLTACVGSGLRQSVTATPDGVRDYAQLCAKPIPELTPAGYIYAGFDLVDEQCGIFFDNLTNLARDTRYTSTSIATANAQAAAILGVVEASAKSIAIVAAGTELARRLVDNYAEVYAFAPYAVEIRRLVDTAFSAYRDDAQVNSAIARLETGSNTGDSLCLAHNIVRNYAKICSIANLDALARQAIGTANVREAGASARPSISTPLRAPTSREAVTFRRTLSLPNFVAGH